MDYKLPILPFYLASIMQPTYKLPNFITYLRN
jgi:hypothetical protein